jgi:hypothetical protein
MAQKFTVPVTIKNLSSAGSDGITVFLDQESYARLKVEAGGRITWGTGAVAGDTNLYRDAPNVLKTDDTFKADGLFVAGTQIDPTGAAFGEALVFNGTKFVSASVAGGGGGVGATVLIQSNPPVGQDEGTLWLDTDTLLLSIYYDGVWEPVSGESALADLTDVSINNLQNGQIIKYSSANSSWYNEYEAIQNVDGGIANSVYGGIVSLSGGGAAG